MAVESMEQEELCAQVNPEIMSHHSKLIYSILSQLSSYNTFEISLLSIFHLLTNFYPYFQKLVKENVFGIKLVSDVNIN